MSLVQESSTPEARPGEFAQAPPYVQAPPMTAPQFRAADPRSKSPALAGFLSLMPGLGQVYVGYYQRGFVHAAVIASIITIISSGTVERLIPLFALFMAFFWLYNVIDAARRASLYNDALAGHASIELPQDFKSPGFRGSIFGGLALLVVGFILLLNTRFGVSLDWVEEWWPLAPMIFGAYLLGCAVYERGKARPDGSR